MQTSLIFPDIATVPCLIGEDTNRRPGTLAVERGRGALWCVDTYSPLSEVGRTTLRGWGALDGPAVNVRPEGAAWDVAVPSAEWDQLQKWAGA